MVTEAEWHQCDCPTLLLAHIRGTLDQRKDRLLAVAFCKVIQDLLEDECKRALAVAENFAERQASANDLRSAFEIAATIRREKLLENEQADRAWDDERTIAADAVRYTLAQEDSVISGFITSDRVIRGGQPEYTFLSMLTVQRVLCAAAYRNSLEVDTPILLEIIHDVVGNPFHTSNITGLQTPAVSQFAQKLYEARAFDQLHILADRCVEAGCSAPALINHLRSGGRHVPGCWALDMLRVNP